MLDTANMVNMKNGSQKTLRYKAIFTTESGTLSNLPTKHSGNRLAH